MRRLPAPSLSSLRLKVLLSLALAGLALMLTLGAVVPRVIVSRFDRQEARRMREDTLRVAAALRTEVGALGTYVANWSSWDDSYRYVQRPTQAYEASNLVPPSFEAAKINLLVFLNTRGEVVTARAYDLERHRWLPPGELVAEVLHTWRPQLRPRSDRDARAGAVWLRSGAWLLAARPVLTSGGDGPRVGTIVMGRHLTPALLADLKRDADLSLTVRAVERAAPTPPEEVQVLAQNERQLQGHVILPDLAGRPTLRLTVGAGRQDHANGLLAARALLLAVLAVVLLFTALSTVLVDRLALGRLSRYHRHALSLLGRGATGETAPAARFPVSGRDELSDLGRTLNELLGDNERVRGELQHQATHDDLTGLPNRAAWKRALADRLGRGEALAVALIDLDNFKAINDTLGHEVGDEVLCGVAACLGAVLPAGGVLARLGGDEFVVLLPDSPGASGAGEVQRWLAALDAPVPTSAGDLFVRASAGVSVWPGGVPGADRAPALLQHADLAMYRAKTGGGGLQVYRPEFSREADERAELERGLRQALRREELWLAYQPVVDLASGRTLGCEALLRWRSPEHGEVSPARFIPVAEERGLITDLGRWVLRGACAQAAAWAQAGAPVRVAVNVSAVQLQQGDFAQDVAATLCQTGLPASSLELEVTETAVTRDLPRALDQLARVRALGVSVALDDFGTGYASLELVRELPLDKLKLDRSFVTGAEHGGPQQVIVASVIRMARDLNLQVVAEGVETPAQRDLLSALACPLAQGYLYARPLSASDFLAHLRGARDRSA